ncbi:hypothetical protein BDW02DRAFT_564251 [Decorospora gaudefroyi]|uniref:Pentacotripeptide-repeat region of PRORP domain-containing protein n=1 Tax=Decorospora gaudefroyi TaxID=184978 RepID=A0A6A5KLE0_9PLEO|nr:hypothetical protein BDW02DRAFT_564251 [Decorospora gaudefroyi]
MPRVRAPNACLIASVDAPVLPFLAPRVFAESPVRSRGRPDDGKNDGMQKEKEKEKEKRTIPMKGPRPGNAQITCQISRPLFCEQRRQDGFAAGLLPTSSQRWKDCDRSSFVNRLYIDISSFARQHARSYATTASADRSLERNIGASQRRSRKPRSIYKPSPLVKYGPIMASVRRKALAIEQARLSNHISRLPPGLSIHGRNSRGQYRSLRRRVSNLLRWDSVHLDLSRPSAKGRKRPGRTAAFAALDRAIYPFLGKYTRKIVIKHHARCVRLSQALFPLATKVGSHQVWTKWVQFDRSTRKAYALRLLVYLLDRKPGRALRFIQVLANDPLLRGRKTEIIADALGHLSKVHAQGLYGIKRRWGMNPESHKRLFVPAFVHIFEKSLAGRPDFCSQDLLYNLVQLAETDDLKKIFDCFVRHRTHLGFDTLLHYASAFGEAGEVPYALRCLDQLKLRHNTVAWDIVVQRERLRWTCATILRKSMSQAQDFHQTPLVVAALVRLGIKMDILLYNVVIHNAMEAGDYATAFKVYNTLEDNGLKPDKYTFSILLHGCTLQNDPATFRDFAQYCASVAKETQDPWLATDYLYYTYVRHQADTDTDHTSALLWQAYSSLFSVTPLVLFMNHGSDVSRPASNSQSSDVGITPPPVALYIMLQMEIRRALASSNQRVLNFYQKFKSVVEERNNLAFQALAQNATIWNAFLLAFCQKQQFASAAQLMQDMINGPVGPNVYSWNILMQAFFKTEQVQAAERVFEIMRHRGIDPDQFTYGVMLRGYAKAQLVERIGETMQHVETEQELSPDLIRALASVVNRRRLMLALEKSRLEKEARAQEKADREAEEERIRWQLADVESSSPTPHRGHTKETLSQDEGLRTFHEDELQNSTNPLSNPPQSITASKPIPQEQSSGNGSTLPAPSVPPNLQDPEVQYKMLKEQLGLSRAVGSSSSSPGSTPNQAVSPFGANMVFKSVLEKNEKKDEDGVVQQVPRFKVRRVATDHALWNIKHRKGDE